MASDSSADEKRWLLLCQDIRDRAKLFIDAPDEKKATFLRTIHEEMMDLAQALKISKEECLKICREYFGEDFPKV
jgi:hypothetical protein